VHAASDRARRYADPADTDEFFIENLVDMVQGALTAPVSARAVRALETVSRSMTVASNK
jgi:hypothetical protein